MTKIKICDYCGKQENISKGFLLGIKVNYSYGSDNDGSVEHHFCNEGCLRLYLDGMSKERIRIVEENKELKYCKNCNQMTNHFKYICLKCKQGEKDETQ